jgi:hypothetical protein
VGSISESDQDAVDAEWASLFWQKNVGQKVQRCVACGMSPWTADAEVILPAPFWGNLLSLCKRCRDGAAESMRKSGTWQAAVTADPGVTLSVADVATKLCKNALSLPFPPCSDPYDDVRETQICFAAGPEHTEPKCRVCRANAEQLLANAVRLDAERKVKEAEHAAKVAAAPRKTCENVRCKGYPDLGDDDSADDFDFSDDSDDDTDDKQVTCYGDDGATSEQTWCKGCWGEFEVAYCDHCTVHTAKATTHWAGQFDESSTADRACPRCVATFAEDLVPAAEYLAGHAAAIKASGIPGDEAERLAREVQIYVKGCEGGDPVKAWALDFYLSSRDRDASWRV